MTATLSKRERLLARGLFVLGVLDLLALPAIFLPFETMESLNQSLGLGELNESPLVNYLTRSASVMYVLYGAILVFLSRDVRRYLPLIRLLAQLAIVHAAVLVAIDWQAELPMWWLLLEGPCYAVAGFFLYWLQIPLAESPVRGTID